MLFNTRQLGVSAILFTLSSMAYATGEGFYLGAGAGPTKVHAKSQTFTTNNVPPTMITISPSTSGIGERLFLGVQFNTYAAIEAGFAHYGTATYKIPDGENVACNNPSIRQNSFDIEGKGIYPFSNSGFDVYAKAGMAVVYAGSSGSLESNGGTNPCSTGTSSKASARPLFGIGASYDLTPQWVAALEYTRYNGGGNVNTADFVALQISYHWVDKYCGQFLC
jgi:opacity protein-like surface antigen